MKNTKHLKFIGTVTASHYIAYFIAGILAMEVFSYNDLFSSEQFSLLMRPVSSPIVFLGPILQLLRGLLLGVILLPIRNVIVEQKYGLLKLGVLIIGLCLVSTIGPTPGSFDGLIYTVIPVGQQLVGYFEAIVYVVLFCILIWLPYRYHKKWIWVVYLGFITVTCLLLIMGYMNSIG